MKKDRNNILISVLCGVVVCFMCLGVVFLLPAKEIKNFKNDSNSSSINQENKNVEEEVILGDYSSCPTGCNCTSKTTTTFTTTSEYASGFTNVNGNCGAQTCRADGCYYYYVSNGGASGLTGYKYTCHAHTTTSYTCDTCKDGYFKDGDSCSVLARSCIIVYNSLSKKFTITGISTNDSPVTRTAVSGHDPSTFTPTSSGEYIGQVWFQDGGTATCSTNITLPTPTPVSCNPGYYVSGGSCVKCSAGTYSVGGSATSCSTCPAGTYSGAGARECSQCNGSKEYSAAGAGSCTQCPTGQFANSSHTGCYTPTATPTAEPTAAPTATPNCTGAYQTQERCIYVEGNNAGCSQRTDGCWAPSSSSGFRVTFYDNAGTSLIATCYTYKGQENDRTNRKCWRTKSDTNTKANRNTKTSCF